MQIEIAESSQVGDARRRAVALAEESGLDETRCGAVALAATEMATNLVKHAGRGYLLVNRIAENENAGVRLISVDRGPGIADVNTALSDGHSTAGSMGTGLGSVKRLADVFDAYSLPGNGALIVIECWQNRRAKPANAAIHYRVVSEPVSGEPVNGDGWGMQAAVDHVTLMVADGLGHGALASEAALEAERILAEAKAVSLSEIMTATHAALRKTRGAAVALARINFEKGVLTYAAVGNISGSIVANGATRSLASHNGTVGQTMHRIQEFAYPWSADSLLILHSDGLATRWDLQRYPGLQSKDPSLIAAMLHRDFSRGRDDATVLVAKPRKLM